MVGAIHIIHTVGVGAIHTVMGHIGDITPITTLGDTRIMAMDMAAEELVVVTLVALLTLLYAPRTVDCMILAQVVDQAIAESRIAQYHVV